MPQEDGRQQGACVRTLAAAGHSYRRGDSELLRTPLDAIAAAASHRTQARSRCATHPTAEDIHHFVELSLVERVGSLGLKLHTGRSRNEQIATDLRLVCAQSYRANHLQALAALGEALVEQAHSAGDAVMPSYTHLQRAEPVLVAHWLLAYVEMILRDASRLKDCAARLNFCPLGSGAVAGRNAHARSHNCRARAWIYRADGELAWTQPAIATLFSSICRR